VRRIQESENSWKAKIARKDGNSIRLKYGDGPVSSITTGARHSEKDAFDEAKSTIDGGRMTRRRKAALALPQASANAR
jgi:hypothetical protein